MGETRSAPAEGPVTGASDPKPGMLNGVRVIEFADETAEYCGMLLAGLGADVVKIEADGINSTRSILPFVGV